jgi:hypothetical protein
MSLTPDTLSQLVASAHPGLLALKASALHVSDIPNPAPASPGPGGGAVTALLSWVKWLALAACAASAIAAGGMIAAGSVSRRSELAERGKTSLLWSVVGAVIVGIGIPLVNHAFKLG